MRIKFAFLSVALLLAIGCDGQSTVIGTNGTGQAEENSTTSGESTPGEITPTDNTTMAMFSGATFVLVEEEPADTQTISFTADTVTWIDADTINAGTYLRNDDGEMIATIAGRDITFSGNGTSLFWETQTYARAAHAQFDSQESLTAYFDGSTYHTVAEFDVGENAAGELVMGQWSVRFAGSEISWAVQDTVSVGNYTFIDGSTFTATLYGREVTIVVLDNDRLVIDSVVYEKDFSDLFDSQSSLVEFLSNSTYRSADLRPIGETVSGTVAVGHWLIDFLSDTFTWTFEDVSVAGTYTYSGTNSFTATLPDRDIEVTLDRGDIMWDGVRYVRQ